MIEVTRTLRADPASSIPSVDDLGIQIAALSMIEFYSKTLGRSKIPLRQLESDWETCAQQHKVGLCDRYTATEGLRRMGSYLQPPVFRLDGPTVSLLPGATQISWSKLPDVLETVHLTMGAAMQEAYDAEIPDQLLAERSRMEEELRLAKTTGESDLLVTCGILGIEEIRQALEDLITNAGARLYFLVAYYEENVDFLAAYIAERVLHARLDLRVIYRPGDAQNRRLILKLQQRLGSSGQADFFRAYDPKFLDESMKSRLANVGRLHAKMALSERELIIGSANLTHLALNHNLEVAIRTRRPQLLAIATSLFERLWDTFDAPNVVE